MVERCCDKLHLPMSFYGDLFMSPYPPQCLNKLRQKFYILLSLMTPCTFWDYSLFYKNTFTEFLRTQVCGHDLGTG